MSLKAYQAKRRFDRTAEPKGSTWPVKDIFVVQLHHARQRHYDFRLQIGKALKSWAVPKGPSFDPAVKRLAVEVEDHPLDYAEFEGEIPHGEYGGGTVAIFDRGTWATQEDAMAQLKKGHLHFALFGKKLKGEWTLVRTGKRDRKQPEWLLIKAQDDYAADLEADDLLNAPVAKAVKGAAKKRPAGKAGAKATGSWAALARQIEGARRETIDNEAFAPELAKSVEQPPDGDDWLREVKWDGYRLLIALDRGKARLWSRNAIEWTARLPQIARAVESLGIRSVRLDGELIALENGKSDFNALQATLAGEKKADLAVALFDLVHLDGFGLSACTLEERKKLLQLLLDANSEKCLVYSAHHRGDGREVWKLASKEGFEGVLSKRATSPYRSGRGDDWRKSKISLSDEFVVVGHTPGKGTRLGFGALLLARADEQGRWHYAGRVGTGFSRSLLARIGKLLRAQNREDSALATLPPAADRKGVLWVDPVCVVEVYYRGFGKEGLLRQSSLKAIREDKTPADLIPRPARKKSTTSRATKQIAEGTNITSPERLVYAAEGITKQQVFDYYRAVMPWLLPQIAGRPLSIMRCPDGAGKACFFQKHHHEGLGEHVRFIPLREKSGKTDEYIYVDDAKGVLQLVQMNVLEFHPWGARIADPEKADLLVLDLDPGPDVTWDDVKNAAVQCRELLAGMALVSFLRLSGGKGLHVVVPLNPAVPWLIAKNFANAVASSLTRAYPDHYIDVATKNRRRGKIFIDYLRNGRGATSVASYSLRARAGAPVALPIAWRELPRIQAADEYDMEAALRKLKRSRGDPWLGIESLAQTLPKLA